MMRFKENNNDEQHEKKVDWFHKGNLHAKNKCKIYSFKPLNFSLEGDLKESRKNQLFIIKVLNDLFSFLKRISIIRRKIEQRLLILLSYQEDLLKFKLESREKLIKSGFNLDHYLEFFTNEFRKIIVNNINYLEEILTTLNYLEQITAKKLHEIILKVYRDPEITKFFTKEMWDTLVSVNSPEIILERMKSLINNNTNS